MGRPVEPVVSDPNQHDRGVDLGQLVLPVYLPMIAGTIGTGMLIPVLPLSLEASGLTLKSVSIVLASAGLGAAIASLPTGSLLARVGERTVLVLSLAVLAITTAALGATTAVLGLVALRMGAGAAGVGLRLSRQTYISRRVVGHRRGRSMAMIGGSYRLSLFVGPLLGGFVADRAGFTTAFVVAGVATAIGLIPSLRSGRSEPAIVGHGTAQFGVVDGLRRHWRLLLLAGVVPLLVMTVREGRFVVLPLISDDLGLGPTAVGLVVSVGTAADLLLFPVAGSIMDRFGRLYAIIPAFTMIAVGLVLLGLAQSTTAVVVAGAVIGIGNGLSAGTMLTFGSDLAPADSTAPFLAGLAAMQDAGRVGGPLVVGAVGAAAGLGTAAIALAIILVVAVVWLVVVIGETGTVQHHAR
ncbi:MAG: MFS transporter [Ilumatobacteraceae bacterium]